MAWYNVPLHTIKLDDILEGCGKSMMHQAGLLKDQQLIEIKAYRQKKCDVCAQYDDGWCEFDENKKNVRHEETGEFVTGCGCNMKCKQFVLHAECPAKKWKAVILA